MPDNSFDVVSKIEMPEVLNAVQQALKEIHQRYDLKDSHSNIELKEKENKILLASKDEFKLKAVVDILESKLVKRQVPLEGPDLRRDHARGVVHGAAGDHHCSRASPRKRRARS